MLSLFNFPSSRYFYDIDDADDLFNIVSFNKSDKKSSNYLPSVNYRETETGYIYDVDVPGLKKENINVQVKDNILTISGERKHESKEEKDGYYYQESSFGSFSRSFTLPDNAITTDIKGSYKNGVLQLTLPKSQETEPKSIQVNIED